MLEPTPGLNGKLVRLGPMEMREMKPVMTWLHQRTNSTNRYYGVESFGYGGYKADGFKAVGIRVDGGLYVLEVELASEIDAMELWLQWA